MIKIFYLRYFKFITMIKIKSEIKLILSMNLLMIVVLAMKSDFHIHKVLRY